MKFFPQNFFLLVLLYGGLISCEKENIPPQLVHGNRIINIFSEKQKENGLHLFGTGGCFSKGIEKFSLDYLYFTDKMTIEESRIILIHSLESFFDIINNDLVARPYIVNYPHSEKNIYFVISFLKDAKSSFLKPNNIASVTCSNGNIFFSEYTDRFKKVNKETYAEAYEKVYGIPFPEERRNAE